MVLSMKKDTMDKKQISQLTFVSKRVGKAIAEYDMLQDQDRVMVAVSGGKDSLSLLRLLFSL